MDTASAFAMASASQGKPLRVFDWDKAARIIRERSAGYASAGLQGDFEWTGGVILRDGRPVPKEDTYTYLASPWAIPILVIDSEEIACYVSESDTEWRADTYWPDSARQIMEG